MASLAFALYQRFYKSGIGDIGGIAGITRLFVALVVWRALSHPFRNTPYLLRTQLLWQPLSVQLETSNGNTSF